MKFPNEASEFVYVRTYARWREDLGRRESWEETVARVMTFLKEQRPQVPDKIYKKIEEHILEMSTLPSMRLVWTAGSAALSDNLGMYNCSFVPLDSIQSFSEMIYLLMHGAGVGFSVQKKYVSSLPEVKQNTFFNKDHVVEDSRQGWADSVKVLLESEFAGVEVRFDYSQIRKKGTRLRTFGGRASGPEPLAILHSFVKDIFDKARGRKLTTVECHDIACQIAESVVMGGVRRSSLISLFDFDDEAMINSKAGYNWPKRRMMANNSMICEKKPTAAEFLKVWATLASNGTGEPGLFNLGQAKMRAPERRNVDLIAGVNPCQPDFATVLTTEGIKTFKDISIGSVIWSGKEWTRVINKVETGVKPVFWYVTTRSYFVGTENHKIVSRGEKTEVGRAKSIDPAFTELTLPLKPMNPVDIIDGLLIGDGMVHKASNNLIVLLVGQKDRDYLDSEVAPLIGNHRPGITEEAYEVKDRTVSVAELSKTFDRCIPARFRFSGPTTKRGFLRGLYTANGSVVKSRITLKTASFTLAVQVQEMLSSLGITSYRTVNLSKIVEFSNGEYECKQSYDVNVSTDFNRFMEMIGFIQKYKNSKAAISLDSCRIPRKDRTSEIKVRQYLGEFPVYSITVQSPDHTYWSGGSLVANCGEAILRSRGLCNLSSVILRQDDDLDDVFDKIEAAVWIGAIQSTFTDFHFIPPEWKANCEDERLLGVSLSGQMDAPHLMTPDNLTAMKKKAIKVAKKAAKHLGINVPAAITVVKPEGTSSQLTNASSGMHPRYAKFYIRRYRISANDSLLKMMKSQGFKATPEVGQSEPNVSTYVVEFPVKAPVGCITRHDVTALQQLEHYRTIQENWCEMNASMTIYVKEDEWFEVGNWVYKNWEIVNGLSFLPFDGGNYQLAPYEEITEAQYEELMKTRNAIDYSKLSSFEKEDNTTGAKTLACSGDKCDI